MKAGSIGDPDIYLGLKLCKVTLDNGVTAWALSLSKYVQEAVQNVEKHLQERYEGQRLPNIWGSGPWPSNYNTELDESPKLNPEDAKLLPIADMSVALHG